MWFPARRVTNHGDLSDRLDLLCLNLVRRAWTFVSLFRQPTRIPQGTSQNELKLPVDAAQFVVGPAS